MVGAAGVAVKGAGTGGGIVPHQEVAAEAVRPGDADTVLLQELDVPGGALNHGPYRVPVGLVGLDGLVGAGVEVVHVAVHVQVVPDSLLLLSAHAGDKAAGVLG